MLNVLSVLNEAVDGDITRIKQAVQISGFYATVPGYTQHSKILNVASDLVAEFLGEEAGSHARAVYGSPSLPLGSPVEISAIFELHR